MATMVFLSSKTLIARLLLVVATVVVVVVGAWLPPAAAKNRRLSLDLPFKAATTTTTTLEATNHNNNNNNNNKRNNDGYKFGDLTRSLGRKITGDRNYQFGDISKKLDERAKARVNQLTGHSEYKFGDLGRYADSHIKQRVANYTGKANYQVGDISKEVVRRVWAGEYDLEDVVLMFRVLLQMGASFTPVARLLPVKVLLEILNVGLAQDVGSKVVGGVAKSLDERFKEAVTGDPKYQLGDKTKDQLTKSLMKITGKDSYTFGDITQMVVTRQEQEQEQEQQDKKILEPNKGTTKGGDTTANTTTRTTTDTDALLGLINNEALAEWDRKLLETKTTRQ